MEKLSISLSLLLSMNLACVGFRWLLAAGWLPVPLFLGGLVVAVGVGAAYVMLEHPLSALPEREAKIYLFSGLLGLLLGLV